MVTTFARPQRNCTIVDLIRRVAGNRIGVKPTSLCAVVGGLVGRRCIRLFSSTGSEEGICMLARENHRVLRTSVREEGAVIRFTRSKLGGKEMR